MFCTSSTRHHLRLNLSAWRRPIAAQSATMRAPRVCVARTRLRLPYRSRRTPCQHRICGSPAYDTIMVFPDQFKNHHPAGVKVQHPERDTVPLVPRMRRESRRLRRQHRLTTTLLGERPRPGWPRCAGTPGSQLRKHFSRAGHQPRPTSGTIPSRSRPQAPHHHRPRQQPDHRLPPRRDADAATRTTCSDVPGVSFGIVSPGRARAHAAERRRVRRGGDPSSSIRAGAMPLSQRRRAALRFIEPAGLRDGERLRVQPAAGSAPAGARPPHRRAR